MVLREVGIALGLLVATSIVSTPATAATFPVGSQNFQITNGSTPDSPTITAFFYNSFNVATPSFDDTFAFTIPQNGVGSGSLSTSFSSSDAMLVITGLFINGMAESVSASSAGQAATVNDIKIFDNIQNTIRVTGYTTGPNGYAGTATFTAAAAAVPEPATWVSAVIGFAMLGAGLRKRRPATAMFV